MNFKETHSDKNQQDTSEYVLFQLGLRLNEEDSVYNERLTTGDWPHGKAYMYFSLVGSSVLSYVISDGKVFHSM